MTFTANKELVCRHAKNDLLTTTDIVSSRLASKFFPPFSPASGDATAVTACQASELTGAEYLTLKPKMDASSTTVSTAEIYLSRITDYRTDLHVMTHKS